MTCNFQAGPATFWCSRSCGPALIFNKFPTLFLRYSLDKTLKFKVNTARSKVKSRSHHDIAHLHLRTNIPNNYQLPIPYFPRYTPDKTLKFRVTTERLKIKSRSPHDTAHLHLPTNVLTKYHVLLPYSFQDITWTKFKIQGHYSKIKSQIKVTP